MKRAQLVLPPKLYAWKQMKHGGRVYPQGSLFPWRDCGLSERQVLVMCRQGHLSSDQHPAYDEKKPSKPKRDDSVKGRDAESTAKRKAEEMEAKEESEDKPEGEEPEGEDEEPKPEELAEEPKPEDEEPAPEGEEPKPED